MTQTEKKNLQSPQRKQCFAIFFVRGLVKAVTRMKYFLLTVLFLLTAYEIWYVKANVVGFVEPMQAVKEDIFTIIYFAICTLIVVAWFIRVGMPKGCISMMRAMKRIGFYNAAEQVPILLSRKKDGENPRIHNFEFMAFGIPLTDWVKGREKLEATLNVSIFEITQGRDNLHIIVKAVPANNSWTAKLIWQDEYLSQDCFELVLGESVAGPVSIDLSKIPHAIIAGSTGSGKSCLMRLLLHQANRKDADVKIIDLKGGVDFGDYWHRTCQMCFDEETALKVIDDAILNLEFRKSLFKANGCANIDEYNAKMGIAGNLKRVIIAVDEISELLDKAGRTKEQKELIAQIESKLSTIARQGRAFGIHFFAGVQRPDANILTGQIKSNIDFRVCGRADNVLSQIVLDSTVAADVIPKSAQGRFVLHDGTVFQAYWLDEKWI